MPRGHDDSVCLVGPRKAQGETAFIAVVHGVGPSDSFLIGSLSYTIL